MRMDSSMVPELVRGNQLPGIQGGDMLVDAVEVPSSHDRLAHGLGADQVQVVAQCFCYSLICASRLLESSVCS